MTSLSLLCAAAAPASSQRPSCLRRTAMRVGLVSASGLAAAFAWMLLLTPIALRAQSSPYGLVYTLCSQNVCADGSTPYAPVVQDAEGNLYGTTVGGGANSEGAVFKVTPSGEESVVYSFCPQQGCADGALPYGGVVRDAEGNLYGTTYHGGLSNGGGVVYKIDTSGHEKVLYKFCSEGGSSCTDGGFTFAGVVLDAAGNIYGVAPAGGKNGGGNVYKIDAAGSYAPIYDFCSQSGCNDGKDPYGGLILVDGTIYGTTQTGGAHGHGVVFEMDTAGNEKVLYSFCADSNCKDGNAPQAPLLLMGGNLYGTTSGGGANGLGTVFEVDGAGSETVLYSLCALGGTNPNGGQVCTDGANPMSNLVADAAGNLYGTASQGGTNQNGTLFKVDPTGHLTTLHNFGPSDGDGTFPYSGPILDSEGVLYGTTSGGGAFNDVNGYSDDGTIYRYSIGSVTPPALAIETRSLPNGELGKLYSQKLSASGGVAPYKWSIASGALPKGLTLEPATGAITGTPVEAGEAKFSVEVKDSDGKTAKASLSITVTVLPLTIATLSLPNAVIGLPYSHPLAAAGGEPPYVWKVVSGALPPGVDLAGSVAVTSVSGKPTEAGTFTFTLQVKDSEKTPQTKTIRLSLVVESVLSISTTSLPTGTVGKKYSQTLHAKGGSGPFKWKKTVGSLPAGLSINASTGVISGTPSKAGTSSFTVEVTDSVQSKTAKLSIEISSAGGAAGRLRE